MNLGYRGQVGSTVPANVTARSRDKEAVELVVHLEMVAMWLEGPGKCSSKALLRRLKLEGSREVVRAEGTQEKG